MMRSILVLIVLCWSLSSLAQSGRLSFVPASKLASIKLTEGISKVDTSSLPEKLPLRNNTSELHLAFTRSKASGEYYRKGNLIIGVRGVNQPYPFDLKKQLQERFLEESEGNTFEHRFHHNIDGKEALIMALETDPNYGLMTVWALNSSKANYLQLIVLYPIGERLESVESVWGFVRGIGFR